MATIDALLRAAQLPDSPSGKLDAEWLLAAALEKPKSYLRTWADSEVPPEAQGRFQGYLKRRRAGEPVAYILGRQGFWSLDLEVEPNTLIPRPDTELLVETALQLLPATPVQVLDLGTGTGAVALALASERRDWKLVGVDRIDAAVALAARNAQRLGIDNARFLQSDWFSALPSSRYSLILSNPPYIRADDPHLEQGDLRFEPSSALVAGSDGLDDIRLIVAQAPGYLDASGWLLLEHGYDQAVAVRKLLEDSGFVGVHSRTDLGGHERISLGRWP